MKVLFRRFLIITLLLPAVVFGREKTVSSPQILKTVVIDAGHGGKDPGCVSGNIYEKNINLPVALLFGQMISKAYPEVKVIYTRTDDTFVEVAERGNIANRAGADLFISIHSDATNNPQANGNSTYVMGNDKANANLEVAKRENAVITLESDYQTKYEGYDPSSAESFIIFSLMQYAYSEQSMVFAEMIQRQYSANLPIIDRGARQAAFLVLWRTAMPSVLTELGFISNAKDRAFLNSSEGQQKAAKALFDAFVQYKTKCDAKAQEAFAQSAKRAEPKPATKTASAATPKSSAPTTATAATATAADLRFYVQLCTLTTESDPKDAKFKSFGGQVIQKQTPTGRWRCLIAADDYASAVELRKKAEQEFGGAFVVAFLGEEHIALDRALKMSGTKR